MTDGEDKFIIEITLHFIGAVVIQILSAGATLAQPIIVQGIVSYLQNEQNKSVGIWLLIAMVFEYVDTSSSIFSLPAHSDPVF